MIDVDNKYCSYGNSGVGSKEGSKDLISLGIIKPAIEATSAIVEQPKIKPLVLQSLSYFVNKFSNSDVDLSAKSIFYLPFMAFLNSEINSAFVF